MPVIESAKATHTTLESANTVASLRFYREVMGLQTLQHLEKAGLLLASNGHFAAAAEVPKRMPQPLLNFYARPVPDAAAVDAVHARISAVREEYRIQAITAPAREDPSKFGVGTYGFYLQDADGNWWRVEENQGPFGPVSIPAGASPQGSIVPAGPISYVMLECRNRQASERFYRDFLGLGVESRPGYFLCTGNSGVHMIVVERGDAMLEQPIINHHGVTLWCEESKIDEIHRAATSVASEFGIKKILPPTHQHGSYSFYLQDLDTNWWEIEVWEGLVDPWTRNTEKLARKG
jgi:catechol 2,3-dioxygenase-like lactoylglutathione lyase family enzyme